MKTENEWAVANGKLSVHTHHSDTTGTEMRFAVFTPAHAQEGPVKVVTYLSGLTCTWANVMEKGNILNKAGEHGFMVIAPDTSPRGEGVPDDDAYDLGQGAGFYLTATQQPWAEHYRMDQYVLNDLQEILAKKFPADMERQAIMGHSMGGLGALNLHLKHPKLFKACTTFAPIVSPTMVPWGEKAFTAYLGPRSEAWDEYNPIELVKRQQSDAEILIYQGTGDQFYGEQLKPDLFREACEEAGQGVHLRMLDGYDHSYYFISTFIGDQLYHLSTELYSATGRA